MPFRSVAQKRFMFANHPEIAKRWAKEFPNQKNLPEHISDKKSGGMIKIKKKNIGKFTATKKATGKTTEELTHSKNPLTKKRAVFAENSKHFKHKLGGEVGYKKGGWAKGNKMKLSEDNKSDVTEAMQNRHSFLKSGRVSTKAKEAKYMLEGKKPGGQRLAEGGYADDGGDEKKDLKDFTPTTKDVHGSTTNGRKYYNNTNASGKVVTKEHPNQHNNYTYSDVDSSGKITGEMHTGTKEEYDSIGTDEVEEPATHAKFKVSLPQKSIPSFGKKEGGEVQGEGTATSDSNPANIKKDSFIIPVAIKNKLKKLLASKPAELNQGGATVPVNLSKGEQILAPNDAKKLNREMKKNGIKQGINILAPHARRKYKMR